MLFYYLNKIYIIVNLFSTYLYLYLTPFLMYFYKNSTTMKKKWYKNYLYRMNVVSKNINIYSSIILNNPIKIKKQKMNLIIMNHSSILDNFILSKLLAYNNFSWNDIRTISRISTRSIQNKTLKIHGSLLLSKNLQQDLNSLKKIVNVWKKSQDCIQIILFPEGIIYSDVINNQKNNYKHLLTPKIGMYNLLLDSFNQNIKYVYDITAVYTSGKKRVEGELNILDALSKNNLDINLTMEEFKLSDIINDKKWLYKRWEYKDTWINDTLV
jgi:hypothetical protein